MHISGNVSRMFTRAIRVVEGAVGERASQYLAGLNKFAITIWQRCKITAQQPTSLSLVSIDLTKEIGLAFPKIAAVLKQIGIDNLGIKIMVNNYAYELRPIIGYVPGDLKGPDDFVNKCLSSDSLVEVSPFSRLLKAIIRDLANGRHLKNKDFTVNLKATGMELGMDSLSVREKVFSALAQVQYQRAERKAVISFSI